MDGYYKACLVFIASLQLPIQITVAKLPHWTAIANVVSAKFNVFSFVIINIILYFC